MAIYKCEVCDYEYDEGQEDARFDELSDEWVCPECGAARLYFVVVDDE